MPGTVDTALTNAVKALQDAKKLAKAASRNRAAGKQARARVDDALSALKPLLRRRSLGPDPGEGPLNRPDVDN
ncbi:MAG: hypothetical protein IT161_21620 [Bryobacterales bacterium]|nr:hypothetical protein [Bryobacterales bacterium]